jgi:steroid 5-alpha reductase family enzyme
VGLLALYGMTALTVYAIVSALWAVSVTVRDASIIDVFWGTLFVAIAWVLLVASAGAETLKVEALVFMVTAWGLRLSFHLGARNIGHGEDSRYALWRRHGGPHWWLKTYYRIYLLQGTIALAVATPIVAVFLRPHDFSLLNAAGVVVWLAGITIEMSADVQLARFRARPDSAGAVMDSGLWRYSRHPNYFGDALQWWGLGLFAFSLATWWALVGPIVMTLVFLYLSNDVIERGLRKRRPDYERYIAQTSAFFPRPPRREAGTAPATTPSRTIAQSDVQPGVPAAPARDEHDGRGPS